MDYCGYMMKNKMKAKRRELKQVTIMLTLL